jgi:hypothetical protein
VPVCCVFQFIFILIAFPTLYFTIILDSANVPACVFQFIFILIVFPTLYFSIILDRAKVVFHFFSSNNLTVPTCLCVPLFLHDIWRWVSVTDVALPARVVHNGCQRGLDPSALLPLPDVPRVAIDGGNLQIPGQIKPCPRPVIDEALMAPPSGQDK